MLYAIIFSTKYYLKGLGERFLNIYDISLPIFKGMPVFEGDPAVLIRPASKMEKGAPLNLTRMSMGSHSGTHVDAPSHFIIGGAPVDRIPLNRFVGRAQVCQINGVKSITRQDLEAAIIRPGISRLLFKTDNCELLDKDEFQKDFAHVSPDAARWLVDKGIQLLGIDYHSIDAYDTKDYPTHHTLLEAGVVILENIDLRKVPPGEYTLICLPLRIKGCDGAPTRAVLLTQEIP